MDTQQIAAVAAPRERPTLFSAPMVCAILANRKTVTRRTHALDKINKAPDRWVPASKLTPRHRKGQLVGWRMLWSAPGASPVWIASPYGGPGDRLWVRETWAHYQTVNSVRVSDGRSFSEVSDGLAGYRADGHDTIEDFRQHVRLMSGCDLEDVIINGDRWRPSIHMPRWASRITLEVVSVRAERLHDITEEDAKAEGVWFDGSWHSVVLPPHHERGADTPGMACWGTAREAFKELWISINGVESWKANPWVWAVSFRRVTQ